MSHFFPVFSPRILFSVICSPYFPPVLFSRNLFPVFCFRIFFPYFFPIPFSRTFSEVAPGKKYGEKSMGKKSTGKNIKAEQGLFRSRDFVTSGEKGPTRADIAQLSVAHAQNILPNMASSVTSGQTCARHHCRLLTLIALPQM
jgi:hypothetical protein